jgi:uncharacterized protein
MAGPLQLQNTFTVSASPQRTWDVLNNVPAVVPCMPGAELIDVLGRDKWKAVMRVKIGPIGLRFDVVVQRAASNDEARTVTLVVDAREAGGKGGATGTIRSSLKSALNGGTDVVLDTELGFDGAVAGVANGPIVSDIARQLTRRFASNLESQLEAGPEQLPAPQRNRPVGAVQIVLGAVWRALRHRGTARARP